MRSKAVIPLAIALGCGLVAAVGVSQVVLEKGQKGQTTAAAEIFVAARDIEVGEEITPEIIRLEKWPSDRVPDGALRELENAEGRYANQRLYAGEPLLSKKLMESGDSAAAQIPEGFRAVTLDVSNDPGTALLIQPGHRVDVVGFFKRSDIIPESTSKTVLDGIRVFAVDGRTSFEKHEEQNRKPAKTVSLLIREEDQEAWAWAQEQSRLRISLRNQAHMGTELATGPNPAGQAFLAWLRTDDEEPRASERTQRLQPSEPPAPAAREQRAWEMVKIGPRGSQVYQWNDAQGMPSVAESGSGASPKTDDAYLDGTSSPFYEPDDRAAPQGSGASADETNLEGPSGV